MRLKIKSVNIGEFGGLKNFKLDFCDRLNIVKGDNESGKSTVQLFILFMLYGLTDSRKKTDPAVNDKKRSLNWDSSRAIGSMVIEYGGNSYKIERKISGARSKCETSVTDIDSGEKLHIDVEPGEYFLGVSKNTFESCCLTAQERVCTIFGEALSSDLSNLGLDSDDGVDGGAVVAKIKAAKKEYRHEKGNGGEIGDLNGSLEITRGEARQIENELASQANDRAKKEEFDRISLELEGKIKEAKAKKEAVKSLKILEKFKNLHRCEEKINKLKKEKDELSKEYGFLKKKPEDADLVEFGSLKSQYGDAERNLRDEKTQVYEDPKVNEKYVNIACNIEKREGKAAFISRLEKLEADTKYLFSAKIELIASALMFVSVTILAFLIGYWLFCFLAAPILLLIAGINFMSRGKKAEEKLKSELENIGSDRENYKEFTEFCFEQKELFEAQKEERLKRDASIKLKEEALSTAVEKIKVVLEKFGYAEIGVLEDFEKLQKDASGYINEKKRIESEETLQKSLIENISSELENYGESELLASLPQGISPEYPWAELEKSIGYEELQKEYRDATNGASQIKGKLNVLGASLDLLAQKQEKIEEIKEKISDCEYKYAVLDTAQRAVEEAYSNIKRNFAPKIRKRASEILKNLTGGDYGELYISDSFEIGVERGGVERESRLLSSGTSDSVYMALRIALIEHIFEGNFVPIIMDESLSQMDGTRASLALRMLDGFVKGGYQCILFTCHGREEKLCGELGIEYGLIKMEK